jgi:YVTN family beta-propeller protein
MQARWMPALLALLLLVPSGLAIFDSHTEPSPAPVRVADNERSFAYRSGPGNSPGSGPYDSAGSPGGVAYTLVPMNGSVVPGSFQPGVPGASGIAYDPIDNRVFIGSTSGAITVLNGSTGEPLKTITTDTETTCLVFDPKLDEVFAAGDPWNVTVIDAATNAIIDPSITVGNGPYAIAYDSKDDKVFVATNYDDKIWVIDPSTNSVIGGPIAVYSAPLALDYDSLDDFVYVSVVDQRILALNGSTDSWESVNWTTGGGPYALALVPGRNWLYVANYGSSNVTVINASSGSIVNSGIDIGGPFALAFSPPTGSVLVANSSGYPDELSSINVSSNTLVGSAVIEPGAVDLAYDSENHLVYATAGSAIGTYRSDYAAVINPAVSLSPSRDIQLQFAFTDSAYDPNNGDDFVIDVTGPNGTGSPTGVNWTPAGPSSVLAINGTTHQLLNRSFPVGHDAQAIRYDAADGDLVVANEGSDSISIVDPSSGAVNSIALTPGFQPDSIGIDISRNVIYVGGAGNDNISVVNGTTDTLLLQTIAVGGAPTAILYDPSSDRIYVSNCESNNLTVINASSRLSTSQGIPVGGCPRGMALDPVSNEVWVANAYPRGGGGESNVTIVNASSGQTVGSVAVGYLPQSIIYDSANGLIYVDNVPSDNLTPIDPVTEAAVGPGVIVDAGSQSGPVGLSYDSATGEIYVPTVIANAIYVVGGIPTVALSVSNHLTEIGATIGFTTVVSGGTPPYSYRYVGLPRGCTTQNALALLCSPNSAGDFSPAVIVTDLHNYSVQSAVSVEVLSRLSSSGLVVSPDAVDVGHLTTLTLGTAGGIAPETVVYNGLPPGCSSNNSTLILCTPASPGFYSIEATVTDAEGVVAEVVGSLEVVSLPSIDFFVADPSSLPLGNGTTFLAVTAGGLGPVEYSYVGLPPGCPPSNSSELTCSPTSAGSFNVSLIVTDIDGATVTATTRLDVTPVPTPSAPSIKAFFAVPTTTTLGNDTTLYVIVEGGAAPLAFNFSGLPAGCPDLSTSALPCAPTTTGAFAVSVTVTDSLGRHASSRTNISVQPAPTITRNSSNGSGPSNSLLALALAGGLVGGSALTLAVIWIRRRPRSPAGGGRAVHP